MPKLQDGLAPPGTMPEPSFTYDEVSMQHSRNFVMALQELKNLRPQLYSAAEYCESSFLYNDQKQVALENLKDYSVKALVNAVDHLGTVAYKLNDLLAQQMTEVSSAEIRTSSLAQRLRSCQEHSDREGLKQQSLAKSTQVNHKHYILPDPVAEVVKRASEQDVVMLRETFDPEQVQSFRSQSAGKKFALGSSSSRNLAWHFAVDRVPTKDGGSSKLHHQPSSKYYPAKESDASFSRGSFLFSSSQNESLLSSSSAASDRSRSVPRSKSTERSRSTERARLVEKSKKADQMNVVERSRSTERRPSSKTSMPSGKVGGLDRSVSQLNSSELDRDREYRAGVSRSKSLLRSLLGKGRIVHPCLQFRD